MAASGGHRPPRRSAFGASPPPDVGSRGAIVRVDGLSRTQAAGVGGDGSTEMLAIGPRTWLALSDGEPDEVREAVGAAAGGTAACTDLTHARVVLRVAGPHARARLSRGCPMDLDTLGAGDAAATLLGPFEVLIRRVPGADDSFDVFVSRSVARSAREWLYGLDSPDRAPE